MNWLRPLALPVPPIQLKGEALMVAQPLGVHLGDAIVSDSSNESEINPLISNFVLASTNKLDKLHDHKSNNNRCCHL